MPKDKEKISRRRQLIFQQVVLAHGTLSFEKLSELLPDNYNLKTAETDVSAFKSIGCNLEIQDCKPQEGKLPDKQLVFLDGPHTDNDTVRLNINREQKNLVARLTASLIFGTPNPNEGPVKRINDIATRKLLDDLCAKSKTKDEMLAVRLKGFLSYLRQQMEPYQGDFAIQPAKEVLRLFQRIGFSIERKEQLRKSLLHFWETTSRLVAIDSGTTNISLCEYLKRLPIPLVNSQLCSLTVCTNSRCIFEQLGPSEVWIKTIILGGQQMFRTPTIAGPIAELFLRSVPILQFGMCILGSTRVDVEKGVVCSDTQEESGVKNLFMERSSLRIICVDDSKLQTEPGREGYRFASIDPKQVDVIVTNSPLFRKGKQAEASYAAFLRKIELIEARGVPVLIATSEKTFGHPGQEKQA